MSLSTILVHMLSLEIESKLKLCYYRRSVGQSVLMSSPHLGPKTRFLLLSDSCKFVDVGPPSRQRGRICRLQLLLVLAITVILGSESCRTHDHVLLSQIRESPPPTWWARFPYLYPPWTGWPSYVPRHWVPFSSHPTTRRATVEVFDSASTRGLKTEFILYNIYTSSSDLTENSLRLHYKDMKIMFPKYFLSFRFICFF
jgi:hypothetical protein